MRRTKRQSTACLRFLDRKMTKDRIHFEGITVKKDDLRHTQWCLHTHTQLGRKFIDSRLEILKEKTEVHVALRASVSTSVLIG
jgi:hypothetical protein